MTTSPDLFLDDGRRVSREDLRRMLPALGYFVNHGVMPDPDLARKIREHPASLKELTGEKGHEALVCHNCESFHYWRQEPHDKCGHMLLPLEEAAPAALETILKNITRNWRKKIVSDILSARYPFPNENWKDKTYSCLVCQNVFKYDGCNSPDRLACSPRHLFQLMGHPWPEGRRWTGFLTFWPSFRKGVVLYLGTSTIREKKCECYLWKMVPHADGMLYAYYGDGEGKYFHESRWAGLVDGREELMRRQAIDESWRIVANTRKTYDWALGAVTK
jgi:hypothetical protein